MASNQRLSRDAWVAGAMALLAESGASAIRVEPLAARLEVTKGSFYWHFRDLSDLQDAVRQEWRRRSTDWFIARVVEHGGDAAARLRKLLELAATKHSSVERSIRAWAAVDGTTAAAVSAVDERRTAFIRDLLLEMGRDDESANALARMLACFVVGELMCGLEPDARYNAAIADAICGPQTRG